MKYIILLVLFIWSIYKINQELDRVIERID